MVASADSDGADGPTDAAAGTVDGYTLQRAAEAGVVVSDALQHHDAYTALSVLGDTICTGIQKTNVRDLRVVYASKP